MKTISFLFIFTTIAICTSAQQANFIWGKQYGGPDAHHSHSICTDPFGNIITAGNFNGFADFDPGSGSANLSSNGMKDAYVGKLDNNGNHLWAVSFGGAGDDQAWDVTTDNFGNIIVVGTFASSSFDADPGANTFTLSSQSSPTTCTFVIKLDANGTFLWAAAYSSPMQFSYVAAKAVAADANGNITVCGEMNVYQFDAVDFDPGFGTSALNENHRYFFLKLTPVGGFVNVFGIEGSYNTIAQISGMELDNESNIYFSGSHYYELDFDISATDYIISGSGYYFTFICKLGASGEFQWVSPITDDQSLNSTSLNIDSENNIYLTGNFAGPADFNPELLGFNELGNSSGYDNGFLLKLDEMGGYIYAKNMGSGNSTICNDVALDEDGNVYVIGSFAGSVDLNPDSDGVENHTSSNSTDVFITKLNSEGSFQYTNVFGGATTDEGRAILFPPQSNGYVATGSFSDTADLDPGSDVFNLTSGGNTDAFIVKYNECQPVVTSFEAIGCGSYEWNGQAYTLPGSYQQTFSASSGCDSLVTLNLSMGSATSSTLTVEACAQYYFDEQEYQTSGDYIGIFTNSQGCDSLVYLDLTIVEYPQLVLSASGNTITATSVATSFQWFNCTTEQLIAGATSPTYSPTQSGSYGVYAYLGPCTEIDCLDFTYIGVEENKGPSFYIYPNPATENINITSAFPMNKVKLSIFNCAGILVMDKNMSGNVLPLDIASLSSGVYYIQIMDNGQLMQQMFIKE
jgi:hypothetical protein